MKTGFELFVAKRYLRARRKEAVISVITVISVLGVSAGVMALVIALGVNNGFRATLQRNLLGAMAHINVIPKQPGDGIDSYQQMAARLRRLPHVTAVSPALYAEVFLTGALQPAGALLKGIDVHDELAISGALRHLQSGSLDRLRDAGANPPGIVLGSDLVTDTGMVLNSIINVVSPQGELTPFGPRPAIRRFRVVGIFKTGFFEVDDKWAFTAIHAEQRMLSIAQPGEPDRNQRGRFEPRAGNRAGSGEDGGPDLHHHHLDGAQPSAAERAEHGARGHHYHHRADRAGGGAQYLHHAGDDGDGKVPGYRRADVDGGAAPADPLDFHAAGSADRDGGQRHRAGGRIHALLLRQSVPTGAARSGGVLDELRAFRSALGGRHLDRGSGHPGELPGDDLSGAQCHPDRAGRKCCVTSEVGMAEEATKQALGLPPAVILESIAHPIIAFDKQWRYLYVSARAAQALGRSAEELIGKCMWDVFPVDMGFRAACVRAWEEGRPITVERYSVVLDQWVESYISPFAGGACAQWRDVSERRVALQALSEAAQRLNAHMDNSPLAIVEFDPQFRVTRWSKGAERLFGWTADDMLGTAIPERRWVYEDDVEKVRQVSADMMEGRRPRNLNVNRNYRKDGSVVECEWYNSAIYDGEGKLTSIFSQVLDITERRRNEERLRQAQKLESVGLLAGGIAHDFNNLLTGIMGNASIALEQAGPGAAERIEEVIRSAERAAGLTRQLLAYSGKGQYVVREIDVAEAVGEIADLVQFSIPKSAGLVITEQRRLPAVRMDPSQLQQVLMNLVINAGEAIGEGNPGRITVGTSMADLQEPLTDAIGEEIAPGRYVCIEVTDNGPGIEADKRSRIFDPFFTTKFTGRGLGLAAVAGILRSQKGGITLESAPGQGSAFRVYLPVANRAEAVREEPQDEGRSTILVVDDEPAVRDFIAAALRKHGFRVLTAADGRDALTACTRENAGLNAVVLDLVMPVMSGNELLPKIKALLPDAKILLTSGYSETEARRLCTAYPGARFIQKPYTARQIARALDDLLAPADWHVAEKE